MAKCKHYGEFVNLQRFPWEEATYARIVGEGSIFGMKIYRVEYPDGYTDIAFAPLRFVGVNIQ